jgi:hypothetical protein
VGSPPVLTSSRKGENLYHDVNQATTKKIKAEELRVKDMMTATFTEAPV